MNSTGDFTGANYNVGFVQVAASQGLGCSRGLALDSGGDPASGDRSYGAVRSDDSISSNGSESVIQAVKVCCGVSHFVTIHLEK